MRRPSGRPPQTIMHVPFENSPTISASHLSSLSGIFNYAFDKRSLSEHITPNPKARPRPSAPVRRPRPSALTTPSVGPAPLAQPTSTQGTDANSSSNREPNRVLAFARDILGQPEKVTRRND